MFNPLSESQHRPRLLIVGNGMVGYKFCEHLVARGGPQRFAITVLGEEPRPAYDRVHLTSYFSGRSADDLLLARAEWYAEHDIRLRLGARVNSIDRQTQCVRTDDIAYDYDYLVLATGSSAFVPPIEGIDKHGIFVYRTIEDLETIALHARGARRVAVIGGGLLGLEAAKAIQDLGLPVVVIEFADRLMCRQLDPAGGRILRGLIEAMGVELRLCASTRRVLGNGSINGLEFADGALLDVDMLVVSAGVRPRDELARACGITVGPRGGIVVDDGLQTSDPAMFAIGECALHRGQLYGLVAPGFAMAEALAERLLGGNAQFAGSDFSTKLKLMGVDVANIGVLPAEDADVRNIVVEDPLGGVYKRLILDADGKRLLGAILVGDASAYGLLLSIYRGQAPLPEQPVTLILGAPGGASVELPDAVQVCSCNNVSKAAICQAIRAGDLCSVADVKQTTRAGTGCGACVPMVTDLLHQELKAAGRQVQHQLCEHFACTRQELFQIIKLNKLKSFEAVIRRHGQGYGCEVCKPAVASMLASLWNEPIFDQATIQDTNDRFMANIQRQGTYSVVPRVPGGEITPEKLIALGQVAQKYQLYCKITGGQRIDLFGARVDQLPDIWEELIDAGFESGHAYGKAVRTVKSCVGTSWCRYGVQDSVAFAIRVENRYKGIRAPHKLKSAVSGCLRECAEARSKDFGYIATEDGYNLYVCGNGGTNPRHAKLFATSLSEDEALRLTDRFLMYYIHTADKLTRTADWLEQMDGGLERLKAVIIDDVLGICAQLEQAMAALVDSFQCEWTNVVRDPEKRLKFRHFAGDKKADDQLQFVTIRGQRQPAPWPAPAPATEVPPSPELGPTRWVRLASVRDVPPDGGIAVEYGNVQLALFHFAAHNAWFASQNMCPHKRDMVLARGLLGDQAGVPKVACPMHKKTFALTTGECLSGDALRMLTFPVHVEGEDVYVELPEAQAIETWLAAVAGKASCADHAACAADCHCVAT